MPNFLLTGASVPGLWLRRIVLTSTSLSYYTVNGDCNAAVVQVLGAGGGGGAIPVTAASNGCAAGGGAAGCWAMGIYTIPTDRSVDTFNLTVGHGGAGGDGSNGLSSSVYDGYAGDATLILLLGNDTISVYGGGGGSGGVLYTVSGVGNLGGTPNMPAGSAGVLVDSSVASSYNFGLASVAVPGASGNNGQVVVDATNISLGGKGADSDYGRGGNGGGNVPRGGLANASAGTGYGSGGGGAGSNTNGAIKNGGAGANGLIIIDEYS